MNGKRNKDVRREKTIKMHGINKYQMMKELLMKRKEKNTPLGSAGGMTGDLPCRFAPAA